MNDNQIWNQKDCVQVNTKPAPSWGKSAVTEMSTFSRLSTQPGGHCFLFSCLVGTDDDDCFYIVLFSILKHSLHSHVILHEWLAFYSAFFVCFVFNIHQSDILYSSGIAGCTWNCCRLGASLCTPYNHAPCHFMQRHICKVYAWMLKVHWTQYEFVFHKLNCWSMTGSLLCKHGICLAVLQFLL